MYLVCAVAFELTHVAIRARQNHLNYKLFASLKFFKKESCIVKDYYSSFPPPIDSIQSC